MKKIIRVTGKGQISVPPDRICLTFTLEDRWDTYQEAVKASKESVEELRKIFKKLEFDEKELKTISYGIDSAYENEKNKDGEWKRVFKGYEYSHILKIEFDLDHELLGKILSKVSKCECHPEFKIAYTIKDKESVKNELLKKAVNDSKVKAEVLAKAAVMKLNDLVSIDYSWGEIDFSVSPYEKLLDCMQLNSEEEDEDMADMRIEPDDIKASDTVTIVWKLSNDN